MINKNDMTKILMDDVGISQDSLELALKLCGDTPRVYKDILFVSTGYSTFGSYEEAKYGN